MLFIIKFLKSLFKGVELDSNKNKLKTLNELDFLDDVWIKDKSNNFLKGWVFDINKKHIFITVPIENEYLDFRFVITRPLTQTQLIQNGVTLFLNKPCK